MALLPVQKIRIYAPKKESAALTSLVQSLGVAELITESSESLQTNQIGDFSARYELARVESARVFLAKYSKDNFFRTLFEGGRSYTSHNEIEALTTDNTANETIELVGTLQLRLAELDRQRRDTEQELRNILTFERLDISLSEIFETKTTSTYPVRGAERVLERTLDEINSHFDTTTAVTRVSPTAALITTLKTNSKEIEEHISTNGLEIVPLPQKQTTATAEITRLREKLSANKQADIEVQQAAVALAAAELPALKKVSDIYRWRTEQAEVTQALPSTNQVVVMTAWIPTMTLATLETALLRDIPASAIESLPFDETDAPTQMLNNSLVQPFESVTNLYGAPIYKDLDPTPLLAVFFFIFFGLCLSDVGYGLILMTLTGIVLLKYHLDTGTKQLMTLLFFGGVGTTIAGVLFGGYFGLSPAQIHPALIPLQQFNPIADPLPVFYLALVLGFIQVAFGIFLNLVRQVKLGQSKDAYLDNGPWLTFFLLAAVAVINFAGFLPEAVSTVFSEYQSTLFIGVALLLVLTQGRQQKNPIMKLLYGILGLYGGVGYFADILSYSRLMALGLATGALAFSINSIALFAGGDSLGIGTIFMVIILVLGHTLNIAISLLGTFINSARLQFVEFFSKFSTGTGRAFTPFYKEPQHIIILPDPPPSP
jgi:V/A-type H+-transporting ATPase subunit I